ncbi:hypothetical protein APY03_4428 [Variovorax sp. WDL1]|nr:hypothetical protein APY03_4428 [Variovorax sp. WDL1]
MEGEYWANRRFWFDTIDGRSVLVNLKHLQGVRFLWNAAPRAPDSRIDPEEPMKIVLVGNKVISEPPPEDAKDLYTLFWELELGNDEVVTFMDVDGELFSLVPDQIVYLSAPKEVVDEGRREADEEDGGLEA